MDIIIGKRQTGKTTELIRRSAKEQICILVADKNRAGIVFKMAIELGFVIPYPVTVEDYFKGDKFRGSCIRQEGVLIDDADDVLKMIFKEIPVRGIALTDHGDIKQLHEERWYRLTRNGVLRSDGVAFMRSTYAGSDGSTVPIRWQDNMGDTFGYAVIENRVDGVYAKLIFDDSCENASCIRRLLAAGDIEPIIIDTNVSRDGALIRKGTIIGVTFVPFGCAYKYEG